MPGDETSLSTGRRTRPRRDDRPKQSSRGRVPPHNIDAEESVLGALLLSREAIGVVSEMALSPNDFQKPAHRHISTRSARSTRRARRPTPSPSPTSCAVPG